MTSSASKEGSSRAVLTLLVGLQAAIIFWDSNLQFLLKFKMCVPFDPAMALWRIYPFKSQTHKVIFTRESVAKERERENVLNVEE